jgi:outer membrane protein TolC
MRRLAAALALAALTSACQTAHPHAPTLAMPAAYESPASGPALTPAELDRWWLQFNDPELNALEADAFKYSPDARTAAARVLEALATRNSQTLQTLPTGKLAGNISRERAYDLSGATDSLIPVGGTTDTQTLNFNVSWELDLFGRLAEARKLANADLAQARFNIEGTRASLAASVADNYFQARDLTIQLADARETVRIQTELERIATRRWAWAPRRTPTGSRATSPRPRPRSRAWRPRFTPRNASF